MKKALLISVIVLMTSVIQGQVTNGLVAKYTFNNGNANDEIGINNGIVYGAHLTNDRFGNSNMAYSFNGVDDYIDGNTISYKLPITVTFWLKASTTNNQWKTVIGWNEPTSPYNGIQFYTTDNLKIAARIGDDTEDLVSNTVVCDGANWYFIAATRVDNNLVLYINDVLDGSRSVSVGIGGPHNLFFGKSFRPSSYNEYLNGAIDDIRIYNRALNKDEIKSLFNEPNPIKTGISDNSINNNRVDFFPNPTENVVHFSEQTNVQLINMTGQIIVDKRSVKELDISNQQKGIYFITFTDNIGRVTQRGKIMKE